MRVMGKGKIGFLRENEGEKEERQVEVKIRNIEAGFKKMISGLKLDERIYLEELELERKIRKELIKIYLRLKALEKKIVKREILSNQADSHFRDFPQRSLELLPEIEALDAEIMPEANAIQQEISKHTLPDVDEIYKEIKLSDEQIKHIRTLASTLNSNLVTSMKTIQEDNQTRRTESMRRTILMNHPELK
jgi:hypothetical protein